MPKIVISYRRTDADATGRICDRLVQRYGSDSVFRDIDNIPFGIDFRKVINDALRDTDVLVAIVGLNWRGEGERASARINEANDLVRLEVETALQRDIPVIPVLVGGAAMPTIAELPESLRDFSFRNAASIDSGRNFDTDVERLMRSMDRLFGSKKEQAAATQKPQSARPIARMIAEAKARDEKAAEQEGARPASPTTANVPRVPPSNSALRTVRALLILQGIVRGGVAASVLTSFRFSETEQSVFSFVWFALSILTIGAALGTTLRKRWAGVLALAVCGIGALHDAFTSVMA